MVKSIDVNGQPGILLLHRYSRKDVLMDRSAESEILCVKYPQSQQVLKSVTKDLLLNTCAVDKTWLRSKHALQKAG
jgi:hypothetical protein